MTQLFFQSDVLYSLPRSQILLQIYSILVRYIDIFSLKQWTALLQGIQVGYIIWCCLYIVQSLVGWCFLVFIWSWHRWQPWLYTSNKFVYQLALLLICCHGMVILVSIMSAHHSWKILYSGLPFLHKHSHCILFKSLFLFLTFQWHDLQREFGQFKPDLHILYCSYWRSDSKKKQWNNSKIGLVDYILYENRMSFLKLIAKDSTRMCDFYIS